MLKMLRDITQAVAAAQDLHSALDMLVSRTKTAMTTQCCSIYLLEDEQLVLSATDGLLQSAVGQVKMSLSEGLVGLVAEREEPINLADAQQHPRFKQFEEAEEASFRAFLAAPIIYQKRILGVLVVQQADTRLFSEGEEAFLMTLAAQLAMAIRNLRKKAEAPDLLHFTGTSAANGIAIAHALVIGGQIELAQPEVKVTDSKAEVVRLNIAIEACKDTLSSLSQRFEQEEDHEVVSIFSALQLLLDNASLGGEYIKEVGEGWSAVSAVSRVSLRYIEEFTQMKDLYLKERAGDIRDLGLRVLRLLIEPERMGFEPDVPVILVTKEADATMLAEFPRHKLVGIVTEQGGVNSHAAILARALGVPAIIGVEGVLTAGIDKKLLIINANRGQLLVSPAPALIAEYRNLISAEKALQNRYAQELNLPAETIDGKRIHLYLNAGLLSSLESEIAEGSDGVGLYRTEIPFMLHQRFPSESEQVKVYRQVLEIACGKPVVMRTLDVGGDKPLAYFPINEENPFLGWRGIRLSLDHPELFLVQLRAMIQAGADSDQLHILLPMVSSLDEIDQAITYLEQAYFELKSDLGKDIFRPKIGIMIEVPALLYQLAEVARRVDFVSVGSNDLTQYMLAVDRNNPRVSTLYDCYHPGILRALKRARFDCWQYHLPVSVCGELAGEPIGVILLVAMGYDQLSMNQGSLARINYLLRRVSHSDLSELLEMALTLSSGQEVRELVREYFESRELGAILN
ncbi:phosphoenolpyruvate--protein phosphotransferase [Shewanella psychropiezotolerans]|uniref:phosphoenolpyruvate--protein phosphotransferase n=1 Tax=Shewanella psychropiezotolerans TaxID=2593655 RepID=A0ABX5X232_9GAMM|nr:MULTISPECIES: phosphoenolpyruvate--protein phosphotransferase [Shewanella]MPY23298.1 phosphoenolpyruvate--protein phosphotransferase [Shewanella sp. YLB-07]QDO85391.1 phosphoenolpyruvate--protein phosphotransferase [Shewanella psychropiezotolerans]